MMKLAVTVLIFFLALSPSQAKTKTFSQVPGSQKHSIFMSRMPTKSVLALAVSRPQRKFLASNLLIDDEDESPAGPDELDLHVCYARPRLASKQRVEESEELSEYVTVRLAIARAKAMEKYREKWA